MRERTTPHAPSPYSLEYPLNDTGLTVHLLSGDIMTYRDMLERLMSLCPGETSNIMAGNYLLALYTYVLWDDPRIEWSCDYDPDDLLLERDDDALLDACKRLLTELRGPGARRCGIDNDALLTLGRDVLPRAVCGLPFDESLPTPATES